MSIKRIEPQAGQESVWDYPRPPRLESTSKHLTVVFGGNTIADTVHAYRVLETSHPPVYYLPPVDIQMKYLRPTARASFCEWKGAASFFSVEAGDKRAVDAAWFYANPTAAFAAIKNYVAFYPVMMDACYVDGELVTPQPGGFYGGWITRDIVGPFKGAEGTWGW